MMFIDENETSHRYVEPKHEYTRIFRATLLIIGYLFLSTKAQKLPHVPQEDFKDISP
jgi:hypothetical protein